MEARINVPSIPPSSTSSSTMTSLRGYSNTTNDSQPYENAFLENSKSSSPKTLHNKLPTSYPANVPQRPSSRDEPGAFGKQPTQSIAPFLARHIPAQYAPQGEHSDIPHLGADISNTKYCYRHRPDLKCRRQANEPTMDQLQNVSHLSVMQAFHCANWCIRNWQHFRNPTRQEFPMFGRSFPPLLRNIGISCFRAS